MGQPRGSLARGAILASTATDYVWLIVFPQVDSNSFPEGGGSASHTAKAQQRKNRSRRRSAYRLSHVVDEKRESRWDGPSATGVENERNGGELFFFLE